MSQDDTFLKAAKAEDDLKVRYRVAWSNDEQNYMIFLGRHTGPVPLITGPVICWSDDAKIARMVAHALNK